MTETEIIDSLRQVLGEIAPDLDTAAIPPDQNLREELELDSMDFLNFVIAVSERLHVEIPEADYGKVDTLGKCARYVAPRLS